QAFERLFTALQNVEAALRKETIANMSQKLRRQFLEYLDGRHSTKESPERSAEPKAAEEESDSDSEGQLMLEDLEPKPKNCRRTPVQAQRGLRRISLQTYSVDCSLFNTMFVTKAASLETSLDYHILLTQVRARSRRHGSNSAGETSELVQKAVEEVLAEKNILAEDMGLKAFVFLQWGRYDNFPSIRSPVLQVEEALHWRTRLLSAAKWEDFRTVWIDLLTHPKFKIKETMDHTQAAAFVDSHEENVTRCLARKALQRARIGSNKLSTLRGALRRVHQLVAAEDAENRKCAAKAKRAKQKQQKLRSEERRKWFLRKPMAQMTTEELMSQLPQHLKRAKRA
ncbi:unnamed protein product, partial [Effrenium voratum]